MQYFTGALIPVQYSTGLPVPVPVNHSTHSAAPTAAAALSCDWHPRRGTRRWDLLQYRSDS